MATKVILKPKIEFSLDMFGYNSTMGGKTLELIEQNEWNGDCLCFYKEAGHAVDIDHRDIASVETSVE